MMQYKVTGSQEVGCVLFIFSVETLNGTHH